MFGFKLKNSSEHLNNAYEEASQAVSSATNAAYNLSSAAWKCVPIATAAYAGLNLFSWGAGKIVTAQALNGISLVNAVEPTFIATGVKYAFNALINHPTALLNATVAGTVLSTASNHVAGLVTNTFEGSYDVVKSVTHLGKGAFELCAAGVAGYNEVKKYMAEPIFSDEFEMTDLTSNLLSEVKDFSKDSEISNVEDLNALYLANQTLKGKDISVDLFLSKYSVSETIPAFRDENKIDDVVVVKNLTQQIADDWVLFSTENTQNIDHVSYNVFGANSTLVEAY